jgi:hypothetical protein
MGSQQGCYGRPKRDALQGVRAGLEANVFLSAILGEMTKTGSDLEFSSVECLEFVFLERLERGRPAAQRVVLGDAVEDVNAAIMEQGGLGDGSARDGIADRALLQRFLADLLNGFEAMSAGAFIFVKRHKRSL